ETARVGVHLSWSFRSNSGVTKVKNIMAIKNPQGAIHMLHTKKQTLTNAIQLALFIGVASMVSGNAFAQDQEKDKDETAKTLDAVTVTGSRIKRAEIEGALPVTVISREELQKSGDLSVADYLR